jgi:hypothetical protein
MMLSRTRNLVSIAAVFAVGAVAGCGGSGTSAAMPNGIALSLGVSALSVAANGTASTLAVNIIRSGVDTNSISLAASGLPAGVTATSVQPLLGDYGSVAFTDSGAAVSGVYSALPSLLPTPSRSLLPAQRCWRGRIRRLSPRPSR